MHKILNDANKQVTDIEIIGGWDDAETGEVPPIQKARVTFQDFEILSTTGKYSNVVLASFVTAYGRLRLFDMMKRIGFEDLIYCDTDSVVALFSPLQKSEIPDGKLLGEFKSEFKPGEYINEFVALGPKCYAYTTNLGKIDIKIKGITQCLISKDLLTQQSLKLVLQKYFAESGGENDDDEDVIIRTDDDNDGPSSVVEPIITVPQRHFKRQHIPEAGVSNEYTEKRCKFLYTKRQVVDKVSFKTVPFGFCV